MALHSLLSLFNHENISSYVPIFHPSILHLSVRCYVSRFIPLIFKSLPSFLRQFFHSCVSSLIPMSLWSLHASLWMNTILPSFLCFVTTSRPSFLRLFFSLPLPFLDYYAPPFIPDSNFMPTSFLSFLKLSFFSTYPFIPMSLRSLLRLFIKEYVSTLVPLFRYYIALFIPSCLFFITKSLPSLLSFSVHSWLTPVVPLFIGYLSLHDILPFFILTSLISCLLLSFLFSSSTFIHTCVLFL